MERIALYSHPDCALHDPGPDHAESTGRLPALQQAIAADAALELALEPLQANPAAPSDLARVHDATYLERLRSAAEDAERSGALVWLDEDTAMGAGSYRAALAGAGCAVAAARRAAAGGRAFALSRPPGHHATRDRAMGFCLVNNVAVAARAVQVRDHVRGVLVVDWDAHHGNGTQDVFYADPSVYLVSVHLDGEYPGTGKPSQRGRGPGRGLTRNVALPPGTGFGEYRRRFRRALGAALAAFSPDVVLVSAGFDLLEGDPEGGFLLQSADLHALMSDLLAALPPSTRGVAAVLEGGYAVERIGAGLVEVLRAMAGLPPSTVA